MVMIQPRHARSALLLLLSRLFHLCAASPADVEVDLVFPKANETYNVKGAFNAVLPNRFAVRLRQQGWPAPVISLVLHFLAGRKAQIRLEGVTSDPAPL
ncbi:reverse transcriptase, partial [Colletotrichum plurivorum]